MKAQSKQKNYTLNYQPLKELVVQIRSQRKTILKTTWSYIQKVNLTDCIYEHCFDVLL